MKDQGLFIDHIPIKFSPGNRWACIRELCGKDEQSIRGTGSTDAIRLLDRILEGGYTSTLAGGNANKLTISDRDRILAAIYTNTYGSKIETTVDCRYCDKPFDIDFSLEVLLNSIDSDSAIEYIEKDSICIFNLDNKLKFRLPTGEDELAVIGLDPNQAEAQLLARCLVEGDEREAELSVQQAMQQLAPLLNLNLDAHCPECEKEQSFSFDMQHYLLSSLIQEQKQLIFEVHQLARVYGWGLNEILDIPRSLRRTYVSNVESMR